MAGIQGATKRLDENNKNLWGHGLARHGDVYYHCKLDRSRHYLADCYFQFNIQNKNIQQSSEQEQAYSYIAASKKPVLVWELGNFRRAPLYNKFGWHSYKHDVGEFNNQDSPGDRWNKFSQSTGIVLKPWASRGSNIVIMGQLEYDSSLISLYDRGYLTFFDWVYEVVGQIRQHTDRPIVVRPHPRDFKKYIKHERILQKQFANVSVSRNFSDNADYKIHGGLGLEQDLKQAWCVVAYSSNSAIEAVCEGIPVFILDQGAAAWPLSQGDLANIENLDLAIDTTQWCNDIAYTLWNNREVASGEVWAHLKPVIFK